MAGKTKGAVSLAEIVGYSNDHLRIHDIGDWSNALNGLQIENSGRVTRIAAAVDISTRVLTAAARKNADLVLVHHGLFWPGLQPVTGALHRQLRIAFENDIALYGAHLPLDVHPKIGNNALLAAALGIKSIAPFLEEKGQLVGLKGRVPGSCDDLYKKLHNAVRGSVKVFGFGPKKPSAIGIITGAAGSEIYRVAQEGID